MNIEKERYSKEDIDNFINSFHERKTEAIKALYYLEFTKRYQEDPKYKKATFKAYLKDKFNMTYSAYYEERIAYIDYREETMEYGVGLIIQIKRKCGVKKIPIVLNEIKKKDKKLKKPIRRDQIDEIIQKYSIPR